MDADTAAPLTATRHLKAGMRAASRGNVLCSSAVVESDQHAPQIPTRPLLS